jgi:uncharacterized damage-inducible protein DinB
MLISNLGKCRTKLLDSFKNLTDEQLNQKPNADRWSIAQVIYHLYTYEKNTSEMILNALQAKSGKVEQRDMSFIADRSKKVQTTNEPPTDFFTKKELVQLLEQSRFHYLQTVFNETHERTLAEKSMEHPWLGQISLKNVIDTIWLHEKRHTEQINEIKQELFGL